MQRHSTFIPLVAVFKFVANRDRSQKVAKAVLAYLRAFSYLRLDFVRSRTQHQCPYGLFISISVPSEADYGLGRLGSCLGPGLRQGPGFGMFNLNKFQLSITCLSFYMLII